MRSVNVVCPFELRLVNGPERVPLARGPRPERPAPGQACDNSIFRISCDLSLSLLFYGPAFGPVFKIICTY